MDDLNTAPIMQAKAGQHGPEQQRLAEAGIELTLTLLKKNADYGSSAWKPPVLKPGMPVGDAILVRMSDKIERLRNLLASPLQVNQVITESVADTMRDLAGYAILWLARPQSLPASVPEKEGT